MDKFPDLPAKMRQIAVKRWLPQYRTGLWSGENLDGKGVEGRYFRIQWLGFVVNFDWALA